MSLLFNMLSRFVIAFLPRSKNTDGAMRYLNQNPAAVFTTRLDDRVSPWFHKIQVGAQQPWPSPASPWVRGKLQGAAVYLDSWGPVHAQYRRSASPHRPFPSRVPRMRSTGANDLRQSLELVLCRILARTCKWAWRDFANSTLNEAESKVSHENLWILTEPWGLYWDWTPQ